jgi:hypothetical protein
MFSVSEGVVGVTVRMLRWILQTCAMQIHVVSKMSQKRLEEGVLIEIGRGGRGTEREGDSGKVWTGPLRLTRCRCKTFSHCEC